MHAPAKLPVAAPTPQHLALALNDQFAPAARFLGTARVVRNPPRVTFVRNTGIDFPKLGTTADHAYWVSRIRARDTAKRGLLDVTSDAFGLGQPATRHRTGRGTLRGGALGPRPYSFERTTWGRAPRHPQPRPPAHLGHEHRLHPDRPAPRAGHVRREARGEVGRAAEGPPGRLPGPRLSAA